MTISPPSNVKAFHSETPRILSSGIDSLTLALQVTWQNTRLFELLGTLKEVAKESDTDEAGRLTIGGDSADWLFVVKPHGKEGYEWMLESREMTMRIGHWRLPKQRPSVLADIRSKTLWLHGPNVAVKRLLTLIETMGGEVLAVKTSRLDLCADVLIPKRDWNEGLRNHFVTRAREVGTHVSGGKFTGITIGRGGLVRAKFYDKAYEIHAKSKKYWMYDHWGLSSVPEGFVVVRVEFQLRRERLKELGCGTWGEVKAKLPNLWVYCTTRWLRLAQDSTLHHTQQSLVSWWEVVCTGFQGAQCGNALVREKAYSTELRQHAQQVVGALGSIIAIAASEESLETDPPQDMATYCRWALDVAMKLAEMSDEEFTRRIIRKQPRYNRSKLGFLANE